MNPSASNDSVFFENSLTIWCSFNSIFLLTFHACVFSHSLKGFILFPCCVITCLEHPWLWGRNCFTDWTDVKTACDAESLQPLSSCKADWQLLKSDCGRWQDLSHGSWVIVAVKHVMFACHTLYLFALRFMVALVFSVVVWWFHTISRFS